MCLGIDSRSRESNNIDTAIPVVKMAMYTFISDVYSHSAPLSTLERDETVDARVPSIKAD